MIEFPEDQFCAVKPRSMFAHYKDYLNFLWRLSGGRQTPAQSNLKGQRIGRHSTKKTIAVARK